MACTEAIDTLEHAVRALAPGMATGENMHNGQVVGPNKNGVVRAQPVSKKAVMKRSEKTELHSHSLHPPNVISVSRTNSKAAGLGPHVPEGANRNAYPEQCTGIAPPGNVERVGLL